MTNLDDIPLMTLIAVEDRPMAGPEIYDALTSHACAIVGAAAGDASAEVAADRDNVEAGADVHDGEANALSVDVVDEKDVSRAVYRLLTVSSGADDLTSEYIRRRGRGARR
jgi:hypothetical protein